MNHEWSWLGHPISSFAVTFRKAWSVVSVPRGYPRPRFLDDVMEGTGYKTTGLMVFFISWTPGRGKCSQAVHLHHPSQRTGGSVWVTASRHHASPLPQTRAFFPPHTKKAQSENTPGFKSRQTQRITRPTADDGAAGSQPASGCQRPNLPDRSTRLDVHR